MIKGCIGFSYVSGHLCGSMLLVRGKRVVEVRLLYPIYLIMARSWKRENFLGKFLFKKSNNDFGLLKDKFN
jgi:hypothetical protein